MASVFLCFYSLLSLLTVTSSSSPSHTIKLSLSPIHNPKSSPNSWEFISRIAKSTLARAHHLKHPPSSSSSSSVLHGTAKTPLYPRSYGGYSVSLSFGTPPQTIPLVFDTGSSLVWVPCTSRYICSNCTFSGINPNKIPIFLPKLSSSTHLIGCRSPKCSWIYGPDVKTRCPGCGSNPANCSRPCPSYLIQYGLGATAGLAVSDNLDLPGQVIKDFLFGCSILSARQPGGIAGFGRAPTSIPNQLKLKKFSYCLLSHKFDDQPKSSDLILTGAGKLACTAGMTYTPFVKNPGKSPYDEYYYVHLSKITVGKKTVKLPAGIRQPSRKGNGGTIVDSGSTLTYMDRAAFDPLVAELAAEIGPLKRAKEAEGRSGFGLCYDVSKEKNVSLPELVFYFKGGARMELPVANYFSFIGETGALCLTIVSGSSPSGPSVPAGPAIILGNYQQMNFYTEYDLEKQRLGFKKQMCG